MSDNAHHKLASYVEGEENTQRYRELVISNVAADEPHRLSLVLMDHERNWETGKTEYIVLPLGKTESVPKKSPRPKGPTEYANFTVPLVLKRYITSDCDKSKADELRKGWIYIYCNGYLWRELQVTKEGICNDVNLQRHQGEDTRKASGEADSRVMVPWKINNERWTIEIAFSEVQWSWARINALGGMNPDTEFERRLKSDTPLSTVSEQDAAKSRSARMLDITDELNDWILSDCKETENIQLVDDVTAEIYTLQLNKQSKFPVVFLKDPLGIAKELSGKYQDACNDMTEYVKKLSSAPGLLQLESVGGVKRNDDGKDSDEDVQERQKILYELNATAYDPIRWFDSARILNQFLYAEIPDTAPEDLTDDEKDEFNKQIKKAKKNRKKYLEKISEEDLKTALRTQERKKIRENIVKTKGRLVAFLESELVTQGEESSLLYAMDDYFTLPAKIRDERLRRLKKFKAVNLYAEAWKVFSEIMQHLDKHEYTFDSDLEPLAEDGWALRKKDGGVNLLIKIADPQENLPIHSRLFPKMADTPLQVDDTKIEDGDPVFKKDFFYNLLVDELDYALETIVDFPDRFHEVISMDDRDDNAYKESIERVRQSLCRFNNGVYEFGFEEVSASIDDILEFKNTDFQAGRRGTLALGYIGETHFEFANKNLGDRANSETVIDEETLSRQKIKGNDVRTSKNSGYELKNVTAEKLKNVKGTGNSDVLHVTSGLGHEVSLVVGKDGPKLNTNARKIYNYRIRAVMVLNEEARNRLFDLMGKNENRIKSITQLLSVVETINALNAVNTVMNNKNDDKRAQLAAELVSSFCDAIVAVGEAAKAVRSMAAEAEGMAAAGASVGRKSYGRGKGVAKVSGKILYMEIIATISGLIDIHLSWKSMVENYRQNDDAYIGSAIMLSGFLLNTFAAGEIATFLGLASTTPVTAAIAIMIFTGVLIYALLADSPIEKWLANGPFALGNGELDYWNNGRYIESKSSVINGRYFSKECTIYQYGGFDQDNASQLVIDDEGNLVGAFKVSNISGRNIFKEENNKIYLKAGEHPLAEEDTLIGVIGRPYTPIPMMQPEVEDRFMGHTPGADPMSHVPDSLFNRVFHIHNPDRYSEYRFAMWCEYPDEACAALLDALYRPQVALEQSPLKFPVLEPPKSIILKISAPYFIHGKSRLDINIEINDHGKILETYTPDQDVIEGCAVESGRYEFVYNVPQGDSGGFARMPLLTFTAKIRLDLWGDDKIQLPHEPLFCGTSIENKSDEKTVKGVQLSTDSKWIVAETEFPCNYVRLS